MKKTIALYILTITSSYLFSNVDSAIINRKYNYINYTEIGISNQTTNFNNPDINYSFQTVNGILINQKTSIGIGIGKDMFFSYNLIPLFLDLRWNLGNKKHGFFLNLSTGYLISNNNSLIKYSSFVNPQIGYRIPLIKSTELIFSLGLQYRYIAFKSYEDCATGEKLFDNKYYYPFKMGFKF
jgi:hypothetical protein